MSAARRPRGRCGARATGASGHGASVSSIWPLRRSGGSAWDAALRKRLDDLGWIDGPTVKIDYRWGAGSVDRMQLFAKELVRLNPDVLVAATTPATAAMQAATHTIPIVFAVVSDPVGSGFVASLAKPGGNITGFINIEASLSGKWLELLRQIAPSCRASASCLILRPHPTRDTIWIPSGPRPRRLKSSRSTCRGSQPTPKLKL